MTIPSDNASNRGPHETNQLVERLFRHEYGRIVSALTMMFGSGQLELAEEVTQETMLKALRLWPYRGIPENPASWLRTTARNLVVDRLRREKIERKHEPQLLTDILDHSFTTPEHGELIADEQLRMMFVCCDPALPTGARAPLILKTLCGFGSREIAAAFLVSVDTIDKRLSRARQCLRETNPSLELNEAEIQRRLPAVLEALYLLFNEGYYSHTGQRLVREELCLEALRLTRRLLDSAQTASDTAAAFYALILLHTARLPARTTADGAPALLESQDRSLWDKALISEGIRWLNKSMTAERPGVYHLQAGIAAEHASAQTYEQTNWTRICEYYDQLCELDASPIIALNRIVAVAKTAGPEVALRELRSALRQPVMGRYHLFWETLGDLQRDTGDTNAAIASYRKAKELTTSKCELRFLEKKIGKCK